MRGETPVQAIQETFLPLITYLKSASASPTASSARSDPAINATQRLFATMFAPHKDQNQPPVHQTTLCEYTNYIRHRYGLGNRYDTTFAQSRYDAFLKWYLENYCIEQDDSRAPLSFQEIAYLNEFVSYSGLEVTRAASFFIEDDGIISLSSSPASHYEVIYWWAVERSRALFVEDCLVPQEYIDVLKRATDQNVDFPLSLFMTWFMSRNNLFSTFPIEKPYQRQLVYYVIMLYALQMPHILRFVPDHWLGNMMASNPKTGSPFEVCHESIFGRVNMLTLEAYAIHLYESGYSTQKSGFTHFSKDGNRILSARLACSSKEQVDIQIIGPLTQTLGLGESSRLLAKAIRSLDYRVNCVDFDLENKSPTEHFDVSEPQPATINILHLNPEAIPTALAYLPDVFSDAYNIGFCYWELDFPADCQLLGLKLLDEVWAASTFITDNLRPYCKDILNMGMTCDFTSYRSKTDDRTRLEKFAISDEDFVFLTVSDALSRVQRKNPVGAIKAFTTAFPDDATVRLIVKTHNRRLVTATDQQIIWDSIEEVAASDSRIIFVDETLSRENHLALVRACDCVVSLHRAEGFGLDLIYAATHDISVLATAYSGNMEFCNNASTWLVGHTEKYVGQYEYAFVKPGHKWVEPNLWEAVEAMRTIRSNHSERARRIDAAKRFVTQGFSPDVFARRIESRVRKILADKKIRLEGAG
jgi:glycosyltransferase involved in cell wall biosynthesis